MSYHEEGKRRRIVRAKYGDARREANEILGQLNRGMAPGQQLRGEDRETYLAALARLRPLGVGLGEAVDEYAKARRAIDKRATLSEVVRFFMAHAPEEMQAKTVQEAYALYLKRAVARTGGRNVESIKLHVGRFVDAFHCQLGDVTHDQLEGWMETRYLSGRYFNNCRTALVVFFRWCRKKDFLPEVETEAEKIERRPELLEVTTLSITTT